MNASAISTRWNDWSWRVFTRRVPTPLGLLLSATRAFRSGPPGSPDARNAAQGSVIALRIRSANSSNASEKESTNSRGVLAPLTLMFST